MTLEIGILDYGAGNMINVSRAIEHLGLEYRLVSSSDDLKKIDKLIIPGVGAFPVAMDNLSKLGLINPLIEFANNGNPVLGICLGMQMLFDESEEKGITPGLGLLKGSIQKIPSTSKSKPIVKVPHVGWNDLIINNHQSKIIKRVDSADSVYFVHSFMVNEYVDNNLIAYCSYENIKIPAIVEHNNIIGCQFHPEKSGKVGLNILNNFLM